MKAADLFRRHLALPPEHGAWVFLGLPLVVGLFAADRVSAATLWVVIASVSGFLGRQPITLIVKATSGRRGREVLPAAWCWAVFYGAIGLLAAGALLAAGHGYVLWLALAGVPVLAWHLALVSRREERRHWLVEQMAGGALALAATAVVWVGAGGADPRGWWLWLLCWAQTSASIVYAYLRLEQRALKRMPDRRDRRRMGRTAMLIATVNVVAVAGLGVVGWIPRWLFVAYAIQWAEAVWGTLHPAVGFKPKAIGMRQLSVSILFTAAFVLLLRA